MRILKITLFILITHFIAANAQSGYTLHIEGFDWGPAVNKVTLPFEKPVSSAQSAEFTVFAHRKTSQGEIPIDQSYGKREVNIAYISDERGNRLASGNHITLVLYVGPMLPIGSPIQYMRINNQGRNLWIDYQLTIFHNKSNLIWQKETARVMPQLDLFNLKGQFKYNDQLTMSYASFEPKNKTRKKDKKYGWDLSF